MSTATLADSRSFSPTLAEMTRRNVEITLAACDVFRAWHRTHFVLKEPTLEQRAEHAMDVRLLLLSLRWLQTSISDPTLRLRDLQARVDTMVRMLEDCWQSVHEPMEAAEAERILAEVFPE